MSVGRFLQQGAAGNAGAGVYVDDVFSTYLYDGTGTSFSGPGQTITNGIDLAGEGGMVWLKARNSAEQNLVIDTVRGGENRLITNDTNAAGTDTGYHISSFNSDGFSLQANGTGSNRSAYNYASWTFRKQPGFFDFVTYTGNATAGTEISHNLGSAPGMIIIKRTNSTSNWAVYHRSSNYLVLNSTAAAYSTAITAARFGDGTNVIAPTESVFTIGGDADTNQSGSTYVAYLFAHDAQDFGTDSDESIIKCGSYTGNGNTTTGQDIDVGFEPQFIMVKGSSVASDWSIYDSMRGFVTNGTASDDSRLMANRNNAEALFRYGHFTSNGFNVNGTSNVNNASGQTYIYIAIRRPHKPAEEFAATDLFDIYNNSPSTTEPVFRTSPAFPVDYAWFRDAPSGTDSIKQAARLTATKYLNSTSTAAEATLSTAVFDYMNGWRSTGGASQYSWMFRRAPGFFDVVTYTGTGSTRTVNHNLGVAPEMMIIKGRSAAYNWQIYAEPLGNTKKLEFTTAASGVGLWNSTSPTDSVFTVSGNNNVNQSTAGVNEYIAYLFASVPGISKVGTYSGTGSDVNVNCGFTSGARFVLVKRTDVTGDWYVWDSVRGIVAGNDPYLLLNSTAAQVTSTDYIDPLSSGFTITSTAPAALNASGGTYLFLAIA